MKDLTQRIGLLIRARYPLLQLVSHEEARVEKTLQRVATEEKLAVYRWAATRGLVAPDGKPIPQSEGAAGALAACEAIVEPALLVFVDLVPHLAEVATLRRLRDLTRSLGPKKQSLVILSARADLPEGLHKDAVVLDVPLPEAEEVGRLLAALLKQQQIELPADRFERFVKGSLGLTEQEIKRLFARILLGGGRFAEEDLRTLVDEKRSAIRRSRVLELWDSVPAMADVGGMDNLKGWLTQRRLGFSAKARTFGLPEPRGMFLLGVQGCGKSLMAKAVAGLWQMPLLRLDVAAVFQSGGSQEESLRETVRVAESLAPVVLWIDEIEKGFLMGGDKGGGGQAFGYFLTWMQEKSKPVFVVATANEVRILPPELLRKGRFDEIFFVDLPNAHERLSVLEIQLRRRGRDPDRFDLTGIVEETERFSGAELEQLVVAALYAAFAASRELEQDDLLDAAREMIPLAVTMDDHLKDLREWARPRARPASMDRRRIDFFSEWEAP
jgi:hypothetical protein